MCKRDVRMRNTIIYLSNNVTMCKRDVRMRNTIIKGVWYVRNEEWEWEIQLKVISMEMKY